MANSRMRIRSGTRLVFILVTGASFTFACKHRGEFSPKRDNVESNAQLSNDEFDAPNVLGILDYHPGGKVIKNGGLCSLAMTGSSERDALSSAGFEYHEVEEIDVGRPVPDVHFKNLLTGNYIRIGNGIRGRNHPLPNCPIAAGAKNYIRNINSMGDFAITARLPGTAKPATRAARPEANPRPRVELESTTYCSYLCICAVRFRIDESSEQGRRACWEKARRACEGSPPSAYCMLEGFR